MEFDPRWSRQIVPMGAMPMANYMPPTTRIAVFHPQYDPPALVDNRQQQQQQQLPQQLNEDVFEPPSSITESKPNTDNGIR